ncbi:MAG: homoserine kinase [Tissierellia bacterium]|nr:homoserine kinase [Tissierellia bacterium]
MKIRVPATSANLGAAFDTLGIALDLYNYYEFKRSNKSKIIEKNYNSRLEDNLIYKSYKKTFEKFHKKLIPVEIKVNSNIPISRGLGSSSACIVAGISIAYLIMDRKIDKKEIFEIANEIEGHPDNVSPCVFGGLNTSIVVDEAISQKIYMKNNYKFIAIIPNFKLNTKKSRDVLPKKVEFKDAIFNVSRVSFLVASLVSGNDSNLKYAFCDKLHQSYRADLIANYDKITDFLDRESIISYLSGAGPTIMAITDINRSVKSKIEDFTDQFEEEYKILELKVDNEGVKIL